jgi:hypothetical protein
METLSFHINKENTMLIIAIFVGVLFLLLGVPAFIISNRSRSNVVSTGM